MLTLFQCKPPKYRFHWIKRSGPLRSVSKLTLIEIVLECTTYWLQSII